MIIFLMLNPIVLDVGQIWSICNAVLLQMLGFYKCWASPKLAVMLWGFLQMLGFSEAGGTLHLNEGHVLSQYQFRLFYLQMPDYQH